MRQAKLSEDFLDFFDVLRSVGVDDVDDVEEKVGVCKLFQGCAEGGYQDGGQLLDEADGVGQEDLAKGVDVPAAGDGVEGGEEFVGGEDSGPGEGVEKCALAGVCVSDQGDDRQTSATPVLPVEISVGPDVLDFLLEAVNLATDEAAVGLQLGLTGASGADSSTEALKVFPLARESREKVFVLGKLDLEAAFSGAGSGGENVEDESGAVDNLCLEPIFENPLLGRGELVVYDDGPVVKLTFQIFDFFQLALAQIGLAGSRELLGDDAHDLAAGALGEEGEFVEGVLEAPKAFDASDGGPDKEGLLGGRVG